MTTKQYHLPLPRAEAMSLEDFLPSSANEEAVRWVLQTPPDGWPSHTLVLCGPSGSGKTHLLSIWGEHHQALNVKVADVCLANIVDGTTSAPAFVLDDADDAIGNPASEEWLQHFYNATKALGRPVLMTAQLPPAQWGLTLRDIETRLKSCACACLHEPDDELTRGLLLKLFRDRQLMVEAGVVEYLAQRVERTGTAIGELVDVLDTAALETGRKISIPFAQKFLVQDQPEAENDDDQNA